MLFCMTSPHLDWDDLRLFLAIARAGTLTAAASRLRLSQPTAGRRLRRLEDACGCALFQRGAAGLRLTDEGEAMLARAERMEEEALALERQLTGGEHGAEGQLRLSSSDWFCRVVLAPPLAGFCAANPRLSVELLTDWRLYDLERREADLVFRFLPFEGPDIVRRRFCEVGYGLFASQAYLREHGGDGDDPAAGFDPRAPHRLIGMDRQFDASADSVWLRRHFADAPHSIRSSNRDVQAAACVNGAGLAVLPGAIGDQLGLIRVDLGEAPPGRTVWLGYHRDLKRLKRLRMLVDHLRARIGETI